MRVERGQEYAKRGQLKEEGEGERVSEVGTKAGRWGTLTQRAARYT